MSLTLPTTYSNSSKLGNIQENWIAQLFHQNSYLSFDGTDDSVSLGATTGASAMSLDNGDDLTVAFWINFPTAGATEFIFANNSQASDYSGVFIYKDSNDKISIGWGDGSGTTSGDRETMLGSTALAVDTWYFITITTDFTLTTTNTVIRVNNSAETVANGGTSGATDPVYESGIAYFGRIKNVYGEFKIRNFGIWAGELDSNNLTALYNSGNYFSFLEDSGNYDQSSALKGYWEFNNGENTIQDKTGNGANGTISGGVYGDFTSIALSDTTVDGTFYHGTITNKPSIRTSVDLAKSTAKTGNISLSVVNFQYKGDDFSAELWGTRKYINRGVKIYSQLSGDTTLANCLQIYQGRLIDISHDTNSIKLSITEQRPWDFISIPQVTSAKGNYFPVVYGDFAENASTHTTPNYIATFSKALHPVQVDSHAFHYHCLNHEDTGSTNKILHYYESGADAFIPVEVSYDAESYSGGFALKTDWHLKRHFKFKPVFVVKKTFGSDSGNVFDGNADQTISDNYATLSMAADSVGGTTTIHKDNNYSIPSFDDPPDAFSSSNNHGLTIEMRWRMTGFYGASANDAGLTVNKVEVFNQSRYATGTLVDTMADGTVFATAGSVDKVNTATSSGNSTTITEATSISNGVATATEFGAYPYNNGLSIRVKRTVTSATDGDGDPTSEIYGTLDVADLRLIGTFKMKDWNTTSDGSKRVNSVKQLYSGHDGFAKSFAGGSGTASTGLEAHRDLLNRFAGWDAEDSSIYNWDDSYPANVDSGSDLGEDLTDVETAIDVDSGGDFQIGNIIKINSEKMLVTNISSNTLTVTRDYLGTTATTHDDNDDIYIVKSSIVEDHRATSAWNIRWWEQEPLELKKILDRMQREFGFIFKFRADGSGSYWVIKDNYTSSDVAQTLNMNDITGLQINNTPFSELLTKMEINYEKHPAENRYISNLTSADTTNNQRNTWNIQAKENVENIDLNMNVNKPGNANPGGGDPNDGFADYYMNISGDVKKIIGCDIVNSAKAYSLETGDIIQFSNTAGEMPVDPFGDNWADFYCITDLKRSPGKVSITAREVG